MNETERFAPLIERLTARGIAYTLEDVASEHMVMFVPTGGTSVMTISRDNETEPPLWTMQHANDREQFWCGDARIVGESVSTHQVMRNLIDRGAWTTEEVRDYQPREGQR